MKAYEAKDGVLVFSEHPIPEIAPDEVLIRVAYAGVNRADIFQRQGTYNPPIGASPILGLEVSGYAEKMGAAVVGIVAGQRICALLPAGGYSEYVAVKAAHCLPVPEHISLSAAAAIPECATTVWMALFEEAALQPEESVLVHGGASGVGTTAIQMLKARGHPIFVTAGSAEKCAACQSLGAEAIDYKTQDFLTIIREKGGVDVVLDMVGGDYLSRNLKVLKSHGRLVMIALLGGAEAEIALGGVLMKQLTISGVTLRGKSDAAKANYMAQLKINLWPLLEKGQFIPVIDEIFPFSAAPAAHEKMEKGLHIGKILLEVTA